MAKQKAQPELLKGWQSIAKHLGQSVAVAERWARESGMPLSRQGRYTVASPEELNQWLARESGQPVVVATESTDLAAELRRGLANARKYRAAQRETAQPRTRKPKTRSLPSKRKR